MAKRAAVSVTAVIAFSSALYLWNPSPSPRYHQRRRLTFYFAPFSNCWSKVRTIINIVPCWNESAWQELYSPAVSYSTRLLKCLRDLCLWSSGKSKFDIIIICPDLETTWKLVQVEVYASAATALVCVVVMVICRLTGWGYDPGSYFFLFPFCVSASQPNNTRAKRSSFPLDTEFHCCPASDTRDTRSHYSTWAASRDFMLRVLTTRRHCI